ncbi:tannase and feruloyl esterase [Rhizodiscina lignyota]|uniref:Carboxylic ester hydrolase n=1 Tax=Rhizodiscina lignyota TaxID=1504668 RepID=A0A9P4M8S4_9PEZI|nr:tannase and feruloyl esterase [Rhizodiscina lignyota]
MFPAWCCFAHHSVGSVISLPGTVESCGGPDLNATITADLCRFVVDTATSASSSVHIEAWLPDNWNGRFMATGNGGEGGCVDYATMQNGAQLRFATFGMNAGHNGSVGFDFFLDKPEVLIDFGYRSMHTEAVVGKELVKQYYGKPPEYNYYVGCSTGGRQGFSTAVNYPDDFNGLLLGSPGIDWLHIVSSKGLLARRIGWPYINSTRYVTDAQFQAIAAKQIELFDPLDGVTDGIIDQPTELRFDPQILSCGTGVLNDSFCLNAEQVESVRAAYEPIADESGNIVYPSFELGSNTGVFSANQVNGTPQLTYTILQDYWRGAIYNDSTWSDLDFTIADADFALKINPGRVNTGETDMTGFKEHGGKIIAYHGRNDETVTSQLSEWYFSRIRSTMDLSLDEIHDFYRLFFIPGMHHCSGGLGAWNIGQTYPLNPYTLDEAHNALSALMEWVEHGRAPHELIGTKYANDDVTASIQAQRKHCVYPKRSKWNGKGHTNQAASWDCISS